MNVIKDILMILLYVFICVFGLLGVNNLFDGLGFLQEGITTVTNTSILLMGLGFGMIVASGIGLRMWYNIWNMPIEEQQSEERGKE